MKLTLFHRAESKTYSGPCDVADVPVLDADGKPAGFVGASWGAHKPGSCLHYAVCEPEDVDGKLESWGLRRVPQDPLVGEVP